MKNRTSSDDAELQPIFIVGQGNSGTTLLGAILDNNPEIYNIKGETWFFINRDAIKRRYSSFREDEDVSRYVAYLSQVMAQIDVSWATAHKHEADLTIHARYAQTIVYILDLIRHDVIERSASAIFACTAHWHAENAGKKYWVEQTPTHVFYIKEILQEYPNARFIHIVRNPLAVVASGKTRSTVRKDKEKWPFDPVLRSIAWRKSVQTALSAQRRHPEKVITVRYEDLVSKSSETIKALCEFLGVLYTKRMLDVPITNTADGRRSSQKGFDSSRLSGWEEVLTPEESAVVITVNRNLMEGFGYGLPSVTYSRRGVAQIIMRFVYNGPRIVIGKVTSGRVFSVAGLVRFVVKRLLQR